MMTNEDIREVVLATLQELGLADQLTVTQRQAERRYGKWFRDAVRRGDLRPCRTGARTRWYSIADIRAYERAGRERARLQLNEIKNTHNNIAL